ncbi:MAG: bifunctional riboflavin kinase/FAD synthetase [Alicyclobacillus sp.]|nr:bifunctional riboflavin kinase/FAD synthetase [Alicyclobacillus sp.]
MQCIEVIGRPPAAAAPQVLALGKFDGLHMGHQAILRAAQAEAAAQAAELAVMSFWPHPAWVLAQVPGYDRALTPLPEKARLLAALGVQRLYWVRFTEAYARIPATEFVEQHLAALRLAGVVVGPDFRFGQGGRADADDLIRLCTRLGITVRLVEPVTDGLGKVSSTRIREHLAKGQVEAAAGLLGRPYTVAGEVVHGDALGRTLGFPTANLSGLDAFVLPAAGVYAVRVEVYNSPPPATDGCVAVTTHLLLGQPVLCAAGVLNVGFRPTVGGRNLRLEVHLLGFQGDLYGRYLRVSFLQRLRAERKFSGLDELRRQIAEDVTAAARVLGWDGQTAVMANPATGF